MMQATSDVITTSNPTISNIGSNIASNEVDFPDGLSSLLDVLGGKFVGVIGVVELESVGVIGVVKLESVGVIGVVGV